MMKLKDTRLLREQCYVDGQWLDAESGQRFAVTDPASGLSLAQVPDCGAVETQRAIAAAQARGFPV